MKCNGPLVPMFLFSVKLQGVLLTPKGGGGMLAHCRVPPGVC